MIRTHIAFTVSTLGGPTVAYGVMPSTAPNGVWIRATSPLTVGMKVLFRYLSGHPSSMAEQVGEVAWVGEEQHSQPGTDGETRQVVVHAEGRRAWIRLSSQGG